MTANYTRETEQSDLAVFQGFKGVVDQVSGTKRFVPHTVPQNKRKQLIIDRL